MTQCAALADPDKSSWNFCPNIGAAYLFAVLFALTTCGHLVQAIIYRKGYSWVIITSGFIQTVNYVARILSIKNPNSDAPSIVWFIAILIAPLFTNAYVYMIMGRMVYNFIPSTTLAGIKAWRISLYFVLLDAVAFLIQIGGIAMAAGNNTPRHQVLLGVHIYMGGIGFQQAFILVFLFLAAKFRQELLRGDRTDRTQQALRLLYVISVVLVLITVRIIFRLIEYSSGVDSTIPNHEVYQYVFDSLPMFVALVLFHVFHPGKLMPGKASDFPSRKERKQMKSGFRENHKNGIPLSHGISSV